MTIDAKTVLILGAGASVDYRFPAGAAFRNQVCELAEIGDFLDEVEEQGVGNIREFLDRFRRSAYSSPDRFLEDFPKYIEAGRYCIARVLKVYESAKCLFPPLSPDQSWYEYLVNQLEPGSDSYYERKLAILTFNYDRSFECYLWNVIESRFQEDQKTMDDIWEARPDVVHLHGQLGPFARCHDNATPYIDVTSIDDIAHAQSDIRIIHEVSPEDDVFDDAERLLLNAERIFFLGFGFDERNVRRLRYFPSQVSDNVIVGGTKIGISNDDWGEIVTHTFEGRINAAAFENSSIYNFLSKPGVVS